MTIAADPVEELVRAALFEFVQSPEVAQAVYGAQQESVADEQLVEQIRDLEKRLDDGAEAFADGEFTRRQVVTVSHKITTQLTRLRARLVPSRPVPWIEVPEEVEQLWGESLDFRRELVDAAIERVVVSKASARGIHADNDSRVEVEWR